MAEMEKLIAGPLAQALETRRAAFNALFAQARRTTPTLDAGVFAEHLRSVVAPIVEEVAVVAPQRVTEIVEVLYEISLNLVAKQFLARHPDLAACWMLLLRGLPNHLAAAPRLFAGSITNALYNLSIVHGARPGEWAEAMRELGQRTPDTTALLEAGKVAAWRAGLAHYRTDALETCRRLEPATARQSLGLPKNAPALETVLEQLDTDPWLNPATLSSPSSSVRQIRIVSRTGGFRGFGGLFLRPPRTAFVEGAFLVSDGEACWTLTADVFGTTFHRIDRKLPERKRNSETVKVAGNGTVTWERQTRVFEELRDCTSFAADGTTLVATVPYSHAVYLVARAV
jgi:hypothetical protein